MDKKTKYFGIALLVLAASICASALPICAPKAVQEGTYDGEKFAVVTDRAFDTSETIYLRGKKNNYYNDPVTIYVIKNDRTWKCADDINAIGYAKKVTGAISDKAVVELGTFPVARYDVFIDENGNGIYDCCKKDDPDCDPCMDEIIDAKAFKCFGFEVLPELATSLLLGAGLLSMAGYFAVVKR